MFLETSDHSFNIHWAPNICETLFKTLFYALEIQWWMRESRYLYVRIPLESIEKWWHWNWEDYGQVGRGNREFYLWHIKFGMPIRNLSENQVK